MTAGPPARIVSLVPSVTELLAALGAGRRVVGRTRYCAEPPALAARVESVGGTKNPDHDRILALRPDLIVMSAEENRREDFERLVAEGQRPYVVHPRTVEEAVGMIEELGRRIDCSAEARALATACRSALCDCRRMTRGQEPLPVFCPIWRQPWMTFRRDTYVGDMLARTGFSNVFASADSDFFEVSVDEVARRGPRLLLLPDEPFAFGRGHGEELHRAGIDAEIALIDGKDLAWYGPRIPRALERLCKVVQKFRRN